MKKKIRLPGGKWITKVLPESNPAELAAALSDEVWECGDGRKILVKDMELRHVINVIRKLEERAEALLRQATGNSVIALNDGAIARMAQLQYPIYIKLVERRGLAIAEAMAAVPAPAQLDLAPKKEERTRMFSLD